MENLTFGTDGIRGVYGDTLTEEVAFKLGAALGEKGPLLIGRDNRPSSPSLSAALAAGARSTGADVTAVGLTTTPALYYLLTRTDATRAVMVTASHNPPAHNGLKVFTREGKPTEAERREIERGMQTCVLKATTPPLREDPALLSLYESFFRRAVGRLDGMTVVLDYAGGAGYAFRDLFASVGARVIPLNLRETGERINEGSGALHPEGCATATERYGADLGIALDGDGDRLIAATREGEILDGDRLVYLLACRMKARGKLKKDRVAMTVMTNGGVLKSLSERGISVLSCAVGDTAVAETMRAEGLNLGGEQSGHVILGDYLMTGDALLVGALLLRSIREDGPIQDTPPPLVYPQILLNVPVRDGTIARDPAVQSLAASLKEELPEGRILVRASGTEKVVRVMVEHPDEKSARRAALRLREEILRRSR